jgi:hypothetical protein
MSVTRVEGTRPLEAAQTIATSPPRRSGGRAEAEHEEAPRGTVPPEDDPNREPASSFRPYALSFRWEKELNRVVVKVIDPTTGELVREIPPESVIETLKQLRQAPGSLVDEEV